MTGDIMTISRLRLGTDGDGVTTLVTFFNCPLHCEYCINDYCHGTGDLFNPTPRALYTPEELINTLKKDDIYYKMSGGGIVFGGGEPLLQSEFIHEVCKLSDMNWKKRIETSLNVPWKHIEPLVDDIDEWIIDIKDIDPEIYKKYTGLDNSDLIHNLLLLKKTAKKAKFRIRVPRIPGYNDEENIEKSVKWVREVAGEEPEVFDYFKPFRTPKRDSLELFYE